jgi:hypothetical protein
LLPLAHLIPEPRQAALPVAFGITAGPPPEPFALAMATLDLLADAAAEQPLLVVAEDLQWLDPATVSVLGFLAGRLEHDPVILLATTRDDEPDPLRGVAGRVLDLPPLERNMSAGSVRAYKLEYLEHRDRLARLLSERVPGLDEQAALHLTRVGVVILAGLWPSSNPTPAIIEANADPRLADAHVDFPREYADMLGLAARGLLSHP